MTGHVPLTILFWCYCHKVKYNIHHEVCFVSIYHGALTRYVKLLVGHVSGMPETFSPPPRVSDHDMHHCTCVTHVPWCMPVSLTSGFLSSRWRRKHSQNSRRMRNLQFCVSGKRPIASSSALNISIWVIVQLQEVVFRGEATRLRCPIGFDRTKGMSWHNGSEIAIASYKITPPTTSWKINEPWAGRGWNIDKETGDLVIPEVLLSDESLYTCGTENYPSEVSLGVFGKLNFLIIWVLYQISYINGTE